MEHGLELIQSYPGNIWKFDFYNFLISWKYWKSDFSDFSYPGNIGNWIFPISGYPGNIGNMIFLDFWDFSKKDARRNFTQNGPVFAARSLI